MDKEHLRITARERQALVEQYRKGASCRVRFRAHIFLFLAEGYSWAGIKKAITLYDMSDGLSIEFYS